MYSFVRKSLKIKLPYATSSRLNPRGAASLSSPKVFKEAVAAGIASFPEKNFDVCLVELSNLKKINQTYGTSVGDFVIKSVENRILALVENKGCVARWSGSEFLVTFNYSTSVYWPNIVLDLREALAIPVKNENCSIHVCCAIGVANYPTHGNNFLELYTKARTATDVAISHGCGGHKLFEQVMEDRASWDTWLSQNFYEAMSQGQLELHYQPKVSLDNFKVTSVEALLRWVHPIRGAISPALFIPYAEKSGLIIPLGQWVLTAAAEQAAAWQQSNQNINIAVNLSAKQLVDPELVSNIKQILTQTKVDPSRLSIELTESCLVSDEKAGYATMQSFRDLGLEVHLDDFGTGYSSLAQLAKIPLDVLKLDGSFFKDIAKDPRALTLVKSIIDMGKALKLKVVAECVETKEQVDLLKEAGVDYAQGYFFGKPMPAPALEKWLALARSDV